MANKMRFGGKLSITPGEPMHIPCHNDPKKKECTNCNTCFSLDCSGAYCDAHNECLCIKTECRCQGR